MAPERWLESRLRASLTELLPGLRGDLLYTQVPALSSGDRGMLDLLTLDRNGRLVVSSSRPTKICICLCRPSTTGFASAPSTPTVSPPPAFRRPSALGIRAQRLLRRHRSLAARAASDSRRARPAYSSRQRARPSLLSPQVEWELIALTEHWRRELKVVFRKRSTDPRN